jgi:hypothetical protein
MVLQPGLGNDCGPRVAGEPQQIEDVASAVEGQLGFFIG